MLDLHQAQTFFNVRIFLFIAGAFADCLCRADKDYIVSDLTDTAPGYPVRFGTLQGKKALVTACNNSANTATRAIKLKITNASEAASRGGVDYLLFS